MDACGLGQHVCLCAWEGGAESAAVTAQVRAVSEKSASDRGFGTGGVC